MKKLALHISQTDIRADPRVLKEMLSLKKSGFMVKGIGTKGDYDTNVIIVSTPLEIVSVGVPSRLAQYLPRILNYFLILLSLTLPAVRICIKDRPDIIHCHDTLALPIGALVGKLIGAKVVYDAHELESDKNGLSKWLGKLTLAIERALWGLVHGLIVVSPSIKDWYNDNVGKKKSEIILNSPEIGSFKGLRTNYLRQKYNIHQKDFIFIYVGILGKGRCLETLIRVFAKPSVTSHLVLLGFGPLEERLRSQASHCKNIHLHQAVEHDDVVSITQSADVGLCLIENVSLSDYLSLPNKLFEYAFSRIPIIASSFPDIKKIVQEYNLGIVCDVDENSVISAIQSIEKTGIFGHSRDISSLGWEAQELKLVSLYRELLADNPTDDRKI